MCRAAQRERVREGGAGGKWGAVGVGVVRERESERERKGEREREGGREGDVVASVIFADRGLVACD